MCILEWSFSNLRIFHRGAHEWTMATMVIWPIRNESTVCSEKENNHTTAHFHVSTKTSVEAEQGIFIQCIFHRKWRRSKYKPFPSHENHSKSWSKIFKKKIYTIHWLCVILTFNPNWVLHCNSILYFSVLRIIFKII